jgi:hypothetical protein
MVRSDGNQSPGSDRSAAILAAFSTPEEDPDFVVRRTAARIAALAASRSGNSRRRRWIALAAIVLAAGLAGLVWLYFSDFGSGLRI